MNLFMILISLLNFSYQGNLEIKDAWVRPGAIGMNTALYFKVENKFAKINFFWYNYISVLCPREEKLDAVFWLLYPDHPELANLR